MGAVTGVGVGADALWSALAHGESCLKACALFDASGFPCHLAGVAEGFSAKSFVPKSYRKAVKVMARDIELAVAAADEAIRLAGLVTRAEAPAAEDGTPGDTTYPADRLGCHIGAGLINAETAELARALHTATDDAGTFGWDKWGTEGEAAQGGMNNLTPLWMLKYLPNMLACHVTIIHGAEGVSNTITNAEASGLLSIGESARCIERGQCDASVAGSAESKVNPMGFTRLALCGRMADSAGHDDARELLKPFSAKSAGTVVGEGGGILVLEDRASAESRGATVLAEVIGFGAAHSSPPVMPPLDSGAGDSGIEDGLAWAVRAALDDAGVTVEQIDAIVPRGSGVPAEDSREIGALRDVFGTTLDSTPIVPWSPATGDLMAGNGGVQAVVATKMLASGTFPRCVNAKGEAFTAHGSGSAGTEPRRPRYVLVCSPALGGQNAALVLSAAT